MELINLSREFLRASKNGCSIDSFLIELSSISDNSLFEQLESENAKKVFWLNLYNAFVLVGYRTETKLSYSNKTIVFKNRILSLDDIEHGILRRSKSKFGLGFFRRFRVSPFEKQARVDKVDFRIHFALNCGANSCPPIFVFSLYKLEEELNFVAHNYLKDSICFKQNENVLKVPRLCLWYFCDFGCLKGIERMLKHYKLIAPDVFPKIRFLKYDWTTNTNNFSIQIDA